MTAAPGGTICGEDRPGFVTTTTLHVLTFLNLVPAVIYFLVGVAAIIGAISAARIREDAFEVADRLPKHNWVLILGGSALVLLILQIIPILPWVALVATGVFWWDVRPQLKETVSGASGW